MYVAGLQVLLMGDSAYTGFSSMNKKAPTLCVNHKEILVMLPALQKWVSFLADKQVHVYSDIVYMCCMVYKQRCLQAYINHGIITNNL